MYSYFQLKKTGILSLSLLLRGNVRLWKKKTEEVLKQHLNTEIKSQMSSNRQEAFSTIERMLSGFIA